MKGLRYFNHFVEYFTKRIQTETLNKGKKYNIKRSATKASNRVSKILDYHGSLHLNGIHLTIQREWERCLLIHFLLHDICLFKYILKSKPFVKMTTVATAWLGWM